ncbi:phospho-sugar mutase [Listeria sp. ILCC792]|uniref:phospho-sugar mutase n=1 Tax=Listeria sp. ILCC792 TaxID=1918331 RepID=UPI000B595430|nr:phospho-sugar mutase [Listeria sp. ILCC792]
MFSEVELSRWQNAKLPAELENDLKTSRDLHDQFYRNLEFGTGGMRGKMGAGPNRINIYTIRRAASGLAEYLRETSGRQKGVAISFDSRIHSRDFALETARVLAAADIPVFLSEELRPTPELSFMVREFQAAAGVMITASHNPAAYNGFKVYDETGCQITLEAANRIMQFMEEKADLFAIPVEAADCPLISCVGDSIDEAYLKNVQVVTHRPNLITDFGSHLKIVYTPLHGSGLKLVTEGLKNAGFKNLTLVPEQAKPDGRFPTVVSPNPEELASFELAFKQAKEQNADIVLATDPDADRLGVAVLDDGEYKILTGNQLGALMLHYLLAAKGEVSENDVLVTTVVTNDLGRKMANHYGARHVETLTGFKFIGEQIAGFEKTGEHFLFGYEESYGYLVAPFVRDKDAIQAALLTAEMALYFKEKGMSLLTVLDRLYDEFGYHKEALTNLAFEGEDGTNKMNELLTRLRKETVFPNVVQKIDFASGNLGLPKTNMLQFDFANGERAFIRPSGTEPKCKIYFQVVEDSAKKAELALQKLTENILTHI